jgi:hypothetical protein
LSLGDVIVDGYSSAVPARGGGHIARTNAVPVLQKREIMKE